MQLDVNVDIWCIVINIWMWQIFLCESIDDCVFYFYCVVLIVVDGVI